MAVLVRHGPGPGTRGPDGRVPGPSRLVVDDRRQYRADRNHQGCPPGQPPRHPEESTWRARSGGPRSVRPWRNERAGLKDGDLAEGSKSA